MKKSKIIYKEHGILTAKYCHPQSDDFLDYSSTIMIKDSGKNPVEMKIKFSGIYPFMGTPPEEHTFKAPSILELYSKIRRWFKKNGYKLN